MRRALIRLRGLCAALLLTWVFPDAALACIMYRSVDLKLVQKADIVFLGTVEEYSPPTYQAQTIGGLNVQVPVGRDYALLRFVVLEVLKGKAPKSLDAIWENWPYAYPSVFAPTPFASALPGTPYVVALAIPGSPWFEEKKQMSPSFEPGDQSYAVVLQGDCSFPFIFPSASEEADHLRQLIVGGRDVQ